MAASGGWTSAVRNAAGSSAGGPLQRRALSSEERKERLVIALNHADRMLAQLGLLSHKEKLRMAGPLPARGLSANQSAVSEPRRGEATQGFPGPFGQIEPQGAPVAPVVGEQGIFSHSQIGVSATAPSGNGARVEPGPAPSGGHGFGFGFPEASTNLQRPKGGLLHPDPGLMPSSSRPSAETPMQAAAAASFRQFMQMQAMRAMPGGVGNGPQNSMPPGFGVPPGWPSSGGGPVVPGGPVGGAGHAQTTAPPMQFPPPVGASVGGAGHPQTTAPPMQFPPPVGASVGGWVPGAGFGMQGFMPPVGDWADGVEDAEDEAQMAAIEEEIRREEAAAAAMGAADGHSGAVAGTGLGDGSAQRLQSGARLQPWQRLAASEGLPGTAGRGTGLGGGDGPRGATSMAPDQPDTRPLCRYHLAGTCTFGASCLYRHADVTQDQLNRAEQVLQRTRDLLARVAKREDERRAAAEAEDAARAAASVPTGAPRLALGEVVARPSVLAGERHVPGYEPVPRGREQKRGRGRKKGKGKGKGGGGHSGEAGAGLPASSADSPAVPASASEPPPASGGGGEEEGEGLGFGFEDLVEVDLGAATGLSEDALRAAESKLSRGLECAVCLDDVVGEGKRFGIQTGCSHCLCVECARTWRGRTDLPAETVRGCPVCRQLSHFVVPCDRFVDHPGRKRELVEEYKASLAQIPCRLFAQGEGQCPFGTSCFYMHAYPDGSMQEMRPPALVLDRDGRLGPRKDFRLSDAVSADGVRLEDLLGLR